MARLRLDFGYLQIQPNHNRQIFKNTARVINDYFYGVRIATKRTIG